MISSPLNIVVEDVVSEAVMNRLLVHLGHFGETTYRITRGNDQIKKNIPKYKGASRVVRHIVLTDLDRHPCPLALFEAWDIGQLPPTMLLRVAVREVEAWLMSDRRGIADFLHAAIEKVPSNPEAEDDPKRALFGVIRRSRKRRLVLEMVPSPGAHIGPLYNERMSDFAMNHWQIEAAAENSPSLSRSIGRLSEFLTG